MKPLLPPLGGERREGGGGVEAGGKKGVKQQHAGLPAGV